ncbi:MAG: 4Fe-4S dicluster domain-containing protein [Thermoprotei archaeon]|nr:MAG: 4Fe-4S dicluster domain-containing protein [Thermoprotei archaeon]RLF00955.1 MAG: 4Fe-4S dicluster domain-containing protein [Thermoprotei archaeon]HDI75402.1 4Fe-4S dicluster domain-containing protein [Thermoprotei archaeon]
MSRVIFHPDKCSGCHICEEACSFQHFGVINISKSRIRVSTRFSPEGVFHEAKVCLQCEGAPCTRVCPTGALQKNEDGHLVFNEDKCIGCMLCAKACPYGLIFKHPELKIPLVCDMCGGDPLCVKWCPMGALEVR